MSNFFSMIFGISITAPFLYNDIANSHQYFGSEIFI